MFMPPSKVPEISVLMSHLIGCHMIVRSPGWIYVCPFSIGSPCWDARQLCPVECLSYWNEDRSLKTFYILSRHRSIRASSWVFIGTYGGGIIQSMANYWHPLSDEVESLVDVSVCVDSNGLYYFGLRVLIGARYVSDSIHGMHWCSFMSCSSKIPTFPHMMVLC